MNYLLGKRRLIYLTLLFVGLFLIGQELFLILSQKDNSQGNFLIRYSGLLCYIFFSAGSFWEVFLSKDKKTL
tara:strand:- start:13094 stop:13309 length:216 start_codon:yes stop_codon:yes gene_type:complete